MFVFLKKGPFTYRCFFSFCLCRCHFWLSYFIVRYCYFIFVMLFLFYFCCFNWALVQAQEPLCSSKKIGLATRPAQSACFLAGPSPIAPFLQAQRSKPKFVAQRAPHRPGLFAWSPAWPFPRASASPSPSHVPCLVCPHVFASSHKHAADSYNT